MKKVFAVVLSGVIFCSSFCGCGKSDSEGPVFKELDKNWYENVKGLYESKYPEGGKPIWISTDEIRGNGLFYFSERSISFCYSTCRGQDLEINLYPDKEEVAVKADLSYADSRFYVSGDDYKIGMKDIEKNIDDMISGTPKTFDIYDDSALGVHGEEVKKDISIMYARLIALSDCAFPELNMSLEDSGISLGEKYRSVDPTDTLSTETTITNEHKFEHGICSDCGMVWTEYLYGVIRDLNEYFSEEWSSAYGQNTSYMIDAGDYVQYICRGKNDSELFYHNQDGYQISKDCTINILDDGDGIDLTIDFSLEEGSVPVKGDPSVTTDLFRYHLIISAAPGEFDKIFASKEALVKASDVNLYITDSETRAIYTAWEDMTEDEIKKTIEDVDHCVYYTKEEFIDLVWDLHDNFLESLDKGMIWFDTSFEDLGINWKG